MTLLSTSNPATFSYSAMTGNQTRKYVGDDNCTRDTENELATTVLPVYVLLITVLGIVLNVFVLLVFLLHKKACTVAEIYLTNLSAADLFMVCCLPFWAVYAAKGFNWPFPVSLCKLVNLAIRINALCSIYFLVLVSVDRYLALVHPLSSSGLRRTKYAKLACAVVWVMGLILSVPDIMYREVANSAKYNKTFCIIDYPDNTTYVLSEAMFTLLGFVIPFPIVCFCTVKIIKALNNRVNGQETEHKATILVLAVLLAFLICWVPFHIARILDLLQRFQVLKGCTLATVLDTCRQVFFYFAFFNSVLNPILYVIVGKNFRIKAEELFKRSSKRRNTLDMKSTQATLL